MTPSPAPVPLALALYTTAENIEEKAVTYPPRWLYVEVVRQSTSGGAAVSSEVKERSSNGGLFLDLTVDSSLIGSHSDGSPSFVVGVGG